MKILHTLSFLVIASICLTAQAAPISPSDIISNWSSERDPVSNGNSANWSQSGSVITNGGNLTGALVSDISTSGDFTFSSTIRTLNDNDLMGLVFGWQDPDNTYLLSWGGGGVGAAWNGIQLTRFSANNAVDLVSQTGNWTVGANYDFSVGRVGNSIVASIVQGASTVFSASIVDTTVMGGAFGFQTWSQETLFATSNARLTTVPEPGTLALGMLGLLATLRKRKRAWLS